MAVVGDAYVFIRAITTSVKPDIEKGLSGLGAIGEKAGKDVGSSFNRGLSGSGGFVEGFGAARAELEKTRQEFRRLSNIGRFLAPAIAAVVGSIGALVGGLVILVAAAGSAARALVVLPAALLALITALGTAKFFLGGISEAFKAKVNAQKGSAAADKAELAALKQLRDARLALQRLLEEEAPEALAAARERAAEAAREAADSLLSAERTQRSYNEAQKESLDAIEDLNAARDAAREKLQQLRFELEGAAISEARARIEFEKARDSLQAVQDLPPNSRARQEAELAFAQAELNLRKAIDSNSDLKKEEDRATKAGVEGSEDVVTAKERLAAAQQREADLAIDTAKAFERAAKAQIAAAQAAADAAAGGKVERELNRRIAEARDRVREAEQAAADAASGGNNALAEAYKNLNKEGIIFVETLDRLRLKFIDIRKETSGPFFTLLTQALETIEAILPQLAPLFEETGRIIGEFALKLSEALFTGEGFERLKRVWATNNTLLQNLGTAAVNLASAFLVILDAAEPLITAFGEWAASSSANFLKELTKDGNDLGTTLANAQRNFENFATLIGNVFEGFGIIGGVINKEGGAADTLLGGLISRSQEWVNGLQAAADDGTLNTYFQTIADNALLLFDVLAEVGQVILDLGAEEGLGPFLVSVKEAVTIFGDLGKAMLQPGGPAEGLGLLIKNVAQLIFNLTDSGALTAFFDTLNSLIEPIIEFTASETFRNIADQIGPLIAQAAAFGLVWRSIKFVLEAFLGSLLLVLVPFVALYSFITQGGAAQAGGFLGSFFRGAGIALRVLTGPIGFIIGAIALMVTNSQMFRDSIIGSFGALGEVFRNTFASLQPVFSEIGDGLKGVFDFLALAGRVVGDILSFVLPVITVVVSTVIGAIGGIIQSIGGLVSIFTNAFGFIGNIIRAFFGLFVGIFTGNFSMFVNATKAATENIKNIFKGVIRFIGGLFVGLINGFIDGWNAVSKRLAFKLPAWLGGFTLQLPQIKRIPDLLANLAKGGVVPATPGGMLARIGEAGRPERVEPLDPDGLSKRDKAMIDRLSGGGGGATINVYPSPGMDERELAEMVSRKLAYQMRRGSV